MTQQASQQIEAWLDDQLTRLVPGARLPGPKEAAAILLVSERSVERVFRRYREQGRLRSIRGKGVFKPDTRPANQRAAGRPPLPSHHNLANLICKSIGSGTLMRGHPLPQIKYMAVKYKVGAPTVVKAYHRLVDMGYVTKIGKTFWVGSFDNLVHEKPQKPVYLLKSRGMDFGDVFENDMLSHSYRRMDRELSASGFFLRFDTTDNLARIWSEISRTGHMPFGLIAYRTSVEEYENDFGRVRALARKIRRACGAAVPILIDWELGGIFNGIPRGVNILSRGHISTSAAKAVARHAAQEHYRRASLFVNHEQHLWHIHPVSGIVKLWTELKNLNRDLDFAFVIKPEPGSTDRDACVREVLEIISHPPDSNYLKKYFDVQEMASRFARNAMVVDDFDEAFAGGRKSDIWLFSSGTDAARALEWCRGHGVRVPADTAILSLDTAPECYRFGISFCSPDWEKIGYAMAHAITGVFPVDRTTKGFIRTEAQLVERTTTK